MKNTMIITLVIFMASLIGCANKKSKYSEKDTLIILDASKVKDSIQAEHDYGLMSTKSGRFWDETYPTISGIPKSLTDIKIYYKSTNNHQSLFQSYKANKISQKNFRDYYNWWNVDSTLCTADDLKNYIIITTGVDDDGNKHYIVDSDNDYRLDDETIYSLDSTYQRNFPHKAIIEKYESKTIISDSTWFSFIVDDRGCWLQYGEHTETVFVFDTSEYSITLYPSQGIGIKYDRSSYFLIKQGNVITKLKQNQFLKLNNNYYRISSSLNGKSITLEKTPNALEIGNTQIGMPPLSFKASTIEGDSIHFPQDFKGKYVLLDFWALSCSPCIYEMKIFYIDIYKKHNKNLEIIGIADNSPKSLKKFIKNNNINWMIIPSKDAKTISDKYNIFQYPTLYLIGPKGNIVSSGNDLRNGGLEKYLITE